MHIQVNPKMKLTSIYILLDKVILTSVEEVEQIALQEFDRLLNCYSYGCIQKKNNQYIN